MCDSLLLGFDANGDNDNTTLLPTAAKVKLLVVNEYSFILRGSAYKV